MANITRRQPPHVKPGFHTKQRRPADSVRGSHAAGISYILIENAKANGHKPRAHLEDVLRHLPSILDKDT